MGVVPLALWVEMFRMLLPFTNYCYVWNVRKLLLILYSKIAMMTRASGAGRGVSEARDVSHE